MPPKNRQYQAEFNALMQEMDQITEDMSGYVQFLINRQNLIQTVLRPDSETWN